METIKEKVKKGTTFFSNGIKKPVIVGLTIGILAAFVQALMASAGGPEAYGFCVACHTRDFVDAIVNAFAGDWVYEASDGNYLMVAPFAAGAISLTIVGVILGAYLSAKKHEEFKVKAGKPLMWVLYFIGGIIVMIFALMLGACPYRAALRFAYGDMVALIGIISIVGGVAVGIVILKIYMNRRET